MLRTLVFSVPRIYHLGHCGVHTDAAACDSASTAKSLAAELRGRTQLSPATKLSVASVLDTAPRKPGSPNGGWGDLRDRRLCKVYGGAS